MRLPVQMSMLFVLQAPPNPTQQLPQQRQKGSIEGAIVPLQFTGSVPTPLDIVISPKAPQIDGTVLNEKQQPVPGTQAVLIPDQHRDRIDLYRIATTDQSGHFTLRSITPGEYKVFAWEALEQFAYFDSDLLRRFEQQGKPVKIAESEKATVEVKWIPVGSN